MTQIINTLSAWSCAITLLAFLGYTFIIFDPSVDKLEDVAKVACWPLITLIAYLITYHDIKNY